MDNDAQLAAGRAADVDDQRKLDGLIILSAVLSVFATLFVGLRCFSRFIVIRNARMDDYLILGALTFMLSYLVALILAREYHLGFPATLSTLDDKIILLKIGLAVEDIYYACIFCIKTSILFTYLRFAAASDIFRKLCIGTIVLHAVFFVICIIVTFTQCMPMNKLWDVTGTVQATCINATVFFYTTSAFNILTDIWILCLPIKTLSSVHRPRREKIALIVVFGVGTFAAIMSLVRLHTIYQYTLSKDPFHDGIILNVWSIVEIGVAICCTCASALKPIFIRPVRKDSRSETRTGSDRGRGTRRNVDDVEWHFRLSSKPPPEDGETAWTGSTVRGETSTGTDSSFVRQNGQSEEDIAMTVVRVGAKDDAGK